MISHTQNSQQLRKVAILVNSLDESLAERMLADLPPSVAVAVRELTNDLGEIAPSERQAVVNDFRQGLKPHPERVQQSQPQLDGVELDASLLERMANEDVSAQQSYSTPQSKLWSTLSDADAATLVEMLSTEQPQTIAIVLARLEPARSAELIANLSPALQTEVLSRLAELDPADEQSLEVVESQLAEWISAKRQRRQRMAAGCELVQRILQASPANKRGALIAQLNDRNPALATKVVSHRQPTESVARFDSISRREQPIETRPTQPPTTVDHGSQDPLSELEALDNRSLLQALRLADRRTVLLALAGANEGLIKRIVQGLPRRRANEFRQQIRAVGPVQLRDMLSAQRELVRFGQANSTH